MDWYRDDERIFGEEHESWTTVVNSRLYRIRRISPSAFDLFRKAGNSEWNNEQVFIERIWPELDKPLDTNDAMFDAERTIRFLEAHHGTGT